MTLKTLACTAILAAAAPLAADASTLTYYLKIDGATGDSTDSKHKNWIDVLSWSWGASSGGGGTSFSDLGWEQGLDSSFVPLFLGLVNGTNFASATLEAVRPATSPAPFFQIVLDSAEVTALSSAGASDGSLLVDAAMSYDAITMRYRKQNADGSYAAWVEGSFTINQGQLSFSGDATVLQGLVEAGGSLDFVNQVPEPASWASMAAGLAAVAALLRRRRAKAVTSG